MTEGEEGHVPPVPVLSRTRVLCFPVSRFLPGTRTRGICPSACAGMAEKAEDGTQAKVEEFKALGSEIYLSVSGQKREPIDWVGLVKLELTPFETGPREKRRERRSKVCSI